MLPERTTAVAASTAAEAAAFTALGEAMAAVATGNIAVFLKTRLAVTSCEPLILPGIGRIISGIAAEKA
jgi:hypothetical protein